MTLELLHNVPLVLILDSSSNSQACFLVFLFSKNKLSYNSIRLLNLTCWFRVIYYLQKKKK